MSNLPYAEDLGHFWKTSKAPADSWIDKTIALIKVHGGIPLKTLTAFDLKTGQSAFLLSFQFEQEEYDIKWPVLPSRAKDEKAARVQAATLLYHSVKAKLLEAEILGMRTAFLPFLALPDGRTASEAATAEIRDLFGPRLPQLAAGGDIDGEFKEL